MFKTCLYFKQTMCLISDLCTYINFVLVWIVNKMFSYTTFCTNFMNYFYSAIKLFLTQLNMMFSTISTAPIINTKNIKLNYFIITYNIGG